MTAWYQYPSNFTYYGQNMKVSGLADWLKYGDYTTGGFVPIAIIVATFVISLFTMKNYPTSKAMAAASWISFVIGVLLSRVLVFNPWFLFVLMIVSIISTIMAAYERPVVY